MLWSAWQLDGQESINVPSDYRYDEFKSPDSVKETYANFAAKTSVNGSSLNLNIAFELRRRQFPQEGYEGFRRAIESARGAALKIFRAEKGGKSHE